MRPTLSLTSGKGKGHRVRVMGVFSAVEHIFNETAMHARAQASSRLARANRASHGPRVRAKERVKKTREKPKESPKEPKMRSKVPKAHTRVKHRKLVYQSGKLETRDKLGLHESAQTCPTDNSWIHDGWNLVEWNDDWTSIGWHEGWERTNERQFHKLIFNWRFGSWCHEQSEMV